MLHEENEEHEINKINIEEYKFICIDCEELL